MTGKRGFDNRENFLARIGREAEVWSLQAVPLPGGLVLLERGLPRLQRQRFLLLLSNRIGPPGPIAVPDEAAHDHGERAEPTNEGSTEEPGPDPEACQVTVEERRHLFGCFRLES